MKKIIVIFFLLLIPNISTAKVTLNCEGKIRSVTTDINGTTSKTEAFYETLSFNFAGDKVGFVYTETSHNFNRPFVYHPPKTHHMGFLEFQETKNHLDFQVKL